MKLKKLEMFGFKSFADKVEFVFEPGITAIVGPNGCGKSNVIDGIKWILGEQSAKSLRGREMSDLIFGGSSSRPAVGYAEASLSISNEENILPIEYKEVTITRRLYASGESEYLINKNQCRLKDIRELFLGTGVGVNSYSIIEQGKVESLLQANAQERRFVFEEAAGISKFKVRKKETLLKLEKVQQNLLRVDDIVSEVEKHLRSIKIQAIKARKYQEFSNRLKQLKIRLSFKNFRDLKDKKDSFQNEINLLLENSKSLFSAIGSIEGKMEDFENQLNNIGRKASETSAEIISINGQAANIQDKIRFSSEKTADLETRESNYNVEVEELNKKIEENEINLKNVKKDLEEIEQETNKEAEYLASKEVELEQLILETDMIAEKIEEKKSKIMDTFHSKSRIQNEIGNQTTLNETLKNRKNRIENQQKEICNQITLASRNKDELSKKYLELTGKIKYLEQEQSGAKSSISELNDEISSYNNNISQHQNILSGKQSRLEVLEDFETRSEGIDAGAKTILNESVANQESMPGICGLVADLIRVDLQFARAIETALGDLAQTVVTRKHDDIINAVNFLKETNSGHATFLPIDKVDRMEIADCGAHINECKLENQGHTAQNQVSELRCEQVETSNSKSEIRAGIIGKASNLVKFEKEYESIVNYLLDKILIVEDFNKASFLIDSIYRNNGNCAWLKTEYGTIKRIITLDGSLIERFGIVRGGIIREKPGLISRKSEMGKIKIEIKEIDQTIERLNIEKEQKTEQLNAIEQRFISTTQDLEKSNILLLNNRNEQKHEDNKNTKLNEEKEVNQSELNEIEVNINSIEKRNREFHDQLNELNNQHRELEEEVNILSEEITLKENTGDSIQDEITDCKITIAQRNEKRESAFQALKRSESHEIEYKNRLNLIKSGIDEYKNKRLKTLIEIAEWEQNLKDFYIKKGKAEELLNTLINDRETVQTQLSEVKTDLSESKAKYKETEDILHDLQLKENECQIKIRDLEERIFEEYNISLLAVEDAILNPEKEEDQSEDYIKELAANILEQDLDWDNVNLEIEELRVMISKIGNVNLDAIKEQDELEERFEFLTNQRNDLDESKKSLSDIIEKLNLTSRELFEKTFNDIKGNFHIYFRKLFGGGKANIVLEDNADILDAGIEIVIQPPNKEFKSISLFSGGEKVLITVALLFAVFKTKPSPFCLMDEVDAALDENNIGRFTMVLKEFAVESQFLIVTHNKKTMGAADIIYGITMEEPGISKKVSVKLNKFED